MADEVVENPVGELTIRVVAMPRDTNPAGDIFGGWLLSQMDLAGGEFCKKIAKGRVVTVSIDSMTFKKPVFIGDTLCIYVHLVRLGRTSITVQVDAYVNREYESMNRIKVTEGQFKYVKVNSDRKSIPINPE